MRFIATADWQLGKVATSFDDDARPRYQQSRFQVVSRIMELAAEREASFVVVAGDAFESNQLDRKVISRTFEAMRNTTIPVYFLPGNHDPLDAVSIYKSAEFTLAKPANVHVLNHSEPVQVFPGAEIVGAPLFNKRPLTDLARKAYEALDPIPEGQIRVLVAHGPVSTLSPDSDDPALIDVPSMQEAIAERKISVAVLGDRHGTYEVAPNIWFPGTPQVTARREVDPGNVLIVEIEDGGRISVEKVRVGDWEFLTIERRLNRQEDVDGLLGTLRELPQKERTALWLVLSGELGPAAYARLDAGLERMADVFAYLTVWESHSDLILASDTADYSELGLGGYAGEALSELVATAKGSGEESNAARGALSLLYRLAGGAR